MLPALTTGVWLSMGLSLFALIWMVIRTGDFRDDPHYALARGNRLTGILYAFGPAMMPWHKESAGRHLATYLLGIVYHVGVFTALAYLLIRLTGLNPGQPATVILAWIMAAGAAAGISLLGKRLIRPAMRSISCPDDFAANILVNVFLVLGALVALELVALNWWYGVTVLLFLYIPVGKIRHCAFFFTTRILYGTFFGRRGVFPDTPGAADKRMKP